MAIRSNDRVGHEAHGDGTPVGVRNRYFHLTVVRCGQAPLSSQWPYGCTLEKDLPLGIQL